MEWNLKTTWVFAVGLLEWEDSETFPAFPDAVNGRFDAKLVDFFRESGVSEKQIIYLQDADTNLEAIQKIFPNFLYQTGECTIFATTILI